MKKKFSKILGVGLTLALLTSLLLTAAPVLADVGQPEVDVDDNEISASTAYVITFDINDELAVDGTDWIEIRFPEGTILDNTGIADADITVQTESTFGNDNGATAVGANTTFTEDPDDVWTLQIDIDDLAAIVSDNSAVMVEFVAATVIDNPDDPGMYTMEVRTSVEDDWVESEEYEIEVPDVAVLPGVVELYNSSDVLMDSDTGAGAIQNMLDDADDGWTLKIGEGEYDEDPDTVADNTDVTIEGSGDVENIIIEGTWTIDVDGITLDNLTLDGDEGAVAILIDVASTNLTVEDCVLQYAGTAIIDDDGSTADDPTIIEDCIFNIDDEIGVDIGTAGVEISGCTFNLDDGGDGVCVEINADSEVSDCTINGGSGVGVQVIAGDSEISGSLFDGLDVAFDIDTGTADINTNTIQGCEGVAIEVAACTEVAIHNNTFTGNNDAAIIEVTADAEDVYIMFNTITDNAGDDDLLIDNNDADIDLECRNNWWGDADGPGDDAFSDDVESEPFLPGPIGNTAIEVGLAFGETADFEDDVSVQVDNDDAADAVDIIGAAQYTENPVGEIDDAVAFWDVCVIDDGDVAQITLRLYTDVTEDSELWVWGEASGEWQEVEAAIPNLFGGFMWVEIDDNSTPTLDDLGDLPFAVVEPPEEDELDDDPVLLAPEVGEKDVPLTPTFAWGAVEDADGYYFELADNANFVAPMVKLDGDLGRLIVTAYAYMKELPYSTAYYLRVKAVSGTVDDGDLMESNWVSGVFITMDEPEEAVPPVVVEETQPPVITIEQPDIVIPLPAETPITPAWIYVIIGVGAVLVIALLVLIVRTRRVA